MAPSEEQALTLAATNEEEDAGNEDRQGDDKLAQKLLKPKRRTQIEVWLGETVSRWETQQCAAGRLLGHHSDLLTPPATGQPGESPRSAPVGDDDICPVCGRSFEDEKPIISQPEGTEPQPNSSKPGKGKHMFRGIRTAMDQLRARNGGKGGDQDGEDRWDRAISTQMFLAEASEHGSSIDTAFSSSGPFGGGDNKALEERMARLMRAQKLLDRSQPRQ